MTNPLSPTDIPKFISDATSLAIGITKAISVTTDSATQAPRDIQDAVYSFTRASAYSLCAIDLITQLNKTTSANPTSANPTSANPTSNSQVSRYILNSIASSIRAAEVIIRSDTQQPKDTLLSMSSAIQVAKAAIDLSIQADKPALSSTPVETSPKVGERSYIRLKGKRPASDPQETVPPPKQPKVGDK